MDGDDWNVGIGGRLTPSPIRAVSRRGSKNKKVMVDTPVPAKVQITPTKRNLKRDLKFRVATPFVAAAAEHGDLMPESEPDLGVVQENENDSKPNEVVIDYVSLFWFPCLYLEFSFTHFGN